MIILVILVFVTIIVVTVIAIGADSDDNTESAPKGADSDDNTESAPKTYYTTPAHIMPEKNSSQYGQKYIKVNLLSNYETEFYKALLDICKEKNYSVCCKVRLEDLVHAVNNDDRGKLLNRHIDFVVVDSCGKVVCCIELDDSSHNTEDSKLIDTLKDNIFKHAGIPLYRVGSAHGDTKYQFEERCKSIVYLQQVK